MATIFEKLFLSKEQVAILDAIKENADKITYSYNKNAVLASHTLCISVPSFELVATCRKFSGLKNTTEYHFYEFAQGGYSINHQAGSNTKFSDKVYSAIVNEFIKRNGHAAILTGQKQFYER